MKTTDIVRIALRYGVLMGISFWMYTILMWLTKLDTQYLSVGKYLDIAIILLPIGIIFLAIHQANRLYKIHIGHKLTIALLVGMISYLIYDPFLYTYHHYINPNWYNSVLELKEAEMKREGISGEMVSKELQKMKTSDTAKAGLLKLNTFIPSVLIMPAIITLLSLTFIRKKKV